MIEDADIFYSPFLEIRTEDNETYLEGIACPYFDGSEPTQYREGSFIERFQAGAFDKYLSTNPTIEARWQHDSNKTFAMTPATLKVWSDVKGLKYRAKLPMDVSWVRDMTGLVKQGVVRGSSFRFEPRQRNWSREGSSDVVTITDATVVEVSPVFRPAYKASQAMLRSRDQYLASLQIAEYEKKLAQILNTI